MSLNSRELILARIRHAVANAPKPEPATVDFRQKDERDQESLKQDFIERLLDYKALVTRTDTVGLTDTLATICAQHAIQRLLVPADIPADWLPLGKTVLRDDPTLSLNELDTSDGILSGCALAIAQTGTIILDGGKFQGRRVLSLIPDRLVCVVYATQIVGLVPEAFACLARQATQPLTLISGPSATSDIELNRVEGVHGPRLLHVLVVDDG